MKRRMTQILLAVVLDLVVGDPKALPHPVRWVGRIIDFFERQFYRANREHERGVLLVLAVLALSLAPTLLLLRLVKSLHLLIGSILIYYTISFKSLKDTASEIAGLLERDELDEARTRVSELVGRDTRNLDSTEIVRATVESLAENASDGVFAPLFYAALGGPIGAVFYRAVNTLDSMVGYRNERYRRFGSASARLDDLLNLIPARLTAASFIAAGTIMGISPSPVIKTAFRDAGKHNSPNAGWPESAMAGLLKVRLGGLNYYDGRPVKGACLGEPVEPLVPERINEALQHLPLAYVVFLAGLSLAGLVLEKVSG